MKNILLVLPPLAILVGGWLILGNRPGNISSDALTANAKETSSITSVESKEPRLIPADEQSLSVEAPILSTQASLAANNNLHNTEVDQIGVDILSDEQFYITQNRLRGDPDFLTSLLAEFRYNTDPERGKRIAALVGELNDPRIVQIAAELAHSGDPASQRMGLDLLSRLQPHNSEARDIAIELLGSETNPRLLVSTMNALTTPARNANDQQRAQLLDNLTLLSTHSDPLVRSHSMSLLGRWNPPADNNYEILSQGLNDRDATVRARSAGSFIGKQNVDESSIYGLLAIAENSNEIKTTRQTALYALKKMSLSPTVRARYEQAVITVRQTRQ